MSFAGRVPRGGPTISVRCGALVATYQQLGVLAVATGRGVARGALLGRVGRSADPRQRRSHVHLGARELATGRYLDPLALLRDGPPALPLAPRPARRAPPRARCRSARSPAVAARGAAAAPVRRPARAPRVVRSAGAAARRRRAARRPRAPGVRSAARRALPRRAAGPPAAPRRAPAPAVAPGRRRGPARLVPGAGTRARPGVPWPVWIGLACVGLGLPFGGFVRLRRRRHATSRVGTDGMSQTPTRAHDPLIIEPMPAPQVELDELYRMSIDQYHRLAEAGLAEDFPHCELIDGVLVRKDMKTAEHENAIAWLMRVAHVRRRPGALPGPRRKLADAGRVRARAGSHGDRARRVAALSPRNGRARDRGVVVVAAARSAAQGGALRRGGHRRVLGLRPPRAARRRASQARDRRLRRDPRRRVRASASRACRPACRTSTSTSCWPPPTPDAGSARRDRVRRRSSAGVEPTRARARSRAGRSPDRTGRSLPCCVG